MNAKSQNIPVDWHDPDDAPELSDEFFEKGVWRVGNAIVTRSEAQTEAVRGRGRPAGSGTKISTTIRFDAEVLEAFKATGDGWQTRMNDVLKDWLRSH